MAKLPNMSNKDSKPDGKKPGFNLTWLYMAVIVGLMVMLYQGNGSSGSGGIDKDVDYTTFRNYVKKDFAKEVVVNKTDGEIRFVVKPEHIREVFKQGSDKTGTAPTVLLTTISLAKSFFT